MTIVTGGTKVNFFTWLGHMRASNHIQITALIGLTGQCQVLKCYRRLVEESCLGLSPASRPKQAMVKVTPAGNISTTTPSTTLSGNHQSRCSGEAPSAITATMPRPNSKVEANIGGTTISPLRS